MDEKQIGTIIKTDDKKMNADQAFELIAKELASSKSNHYGCSWTLKADGSLVHNCNEVSHE